MRFDAPDGPAVLLSDHDSVHVAVSQIDAGGPPSSRVVQRQRADAPEPGSCDGAEWQDAGDSDTLGQLDPAGSPEAGWSFDATGLRDGCVRWTVRLTFDEGPAASWDSGPVIVDTTAPPAPRVRGAGKWAWQLGQDTPVWVRSGKKGTLTLSITGTDPASGTASTQVGNITGGHGWTVVGSPDPGSPTTLTVRWTASATDASLVLRSIDATGHTGAPRTIQLKVDASAPRAPQWIWPKPGRVTVVDATPELLWRGVSDQGSGPASLQLVRRDRGAIQHLGSCQGVSWVRDGPARLLDKHHVERDVASGYCYRYVLTPLDEVGNRGPSTVSGVILSDVTAPTANFQTPDEGTTRVIHSSSLVVRWTDRETGGSGGLHGRSLERERGRIVHADNCKGVTWLLDGAVDHGASPSRQSGLRDGYCYRWRLNLVDGANMAAAYLSGKVLVKL
jgi:hypothetical protein